VRLSAVQIWFATLDTDKALIGEFEATLSPQQRERASRFVFERHKIRYIFAQGVLRDVLSRATGLSPASIGFVLNDFGKPYLQTAAGKSSLQFNLSHSEDLVAIGVVELREVGVDVEFIRPMANLEDIAASVYTPGELASLMQAPGAERQRLFFRYWTRKESYIKAIGKGLSIPLNTFDTRYPRVEDWWIQDLGSVPAGYSGAVTVERGIEDIASCEWLPR
jgi:4'-phosphopantetheinyl transferase